MKFEITVLGNTLSGTAWYEGGDISSNLPREKCEFCGEPDCLFDCDESASGAGTEVGGRIRHNICLDFLEALVLAHAAAGIDVARPAYVRGLETALEGLANHL